MASSSSTPMARLSGGPAKRDESPAASASLWVLSPCGVSSNIQASTSTGITPISSTTTSARAIHSGAPNNGSTVVETCTSTHATTA